MLKGRRRKCSYSTENANESSLEGTVFSLDSAILSKTSLCMDNGAQIRVRNLPSNAKIKLYPVRMNDMVPIFKSESYYKHKKPVRVIVSRDKLQEMFNDCEDEDEWETVRCVDKPVKPILTQRCGEKPVKNEVQYTVCRNEQRVKNPFLRKKLKRKVSYPTKRRSRMTTRKKSSTFRRSPKHLLPRRKISPCRFRAPRSGSSVRSRVKRCRSRSRTPTRSRCRPIKQPSRSRSKSCARPKSPPPRPRRLRSPRPSFTTVKMKDTTVCQACGRCLDETCCEHTRHLQVKNEHRQTPSSPPSPQRGRCLERQTPSSTPSPPRGRCLERQTPSSPPSPPRGRCLERRPTPMPRRTHAPTASCLRPSPPPLSCPQPSIIRECVREECYMAPPAPPPTPTDAGYDPYCSACEMESQIVSPTCCCNAMYCKQKLPMRNSWSNEYAVIKPRQCELPCPRVPLCSTNQKSCIYDTKGCPLTDSLGFPMRDCSGRPILRFDCDGSPINCYYDHDDQSFYNSYDRCSECHMFIPCCDVESPSPCSADNNLCFKCSVDNDRCCEVNFATKHKRSPFFDSVIKYFRKV